MKNKRFEGEIVCERVVDGKVENAVIMPYHRFFAATPEEAIDYLKMKHGERILKDKSDGWEVAILIRPFCSE